MIQDATTMAERLCYMELMINLNGFKQLGLSARRLRLNCNRLQMRRNKMDDLSQRQQTMETIPLVLAQKDNEERSLNEI